MFKTRLRKTIKIIRIHFIASKAAEEDKRCRVNRTRSKHPILRRHNTLHFTIRLNSKVTR